MKGTGWEHEGARVVALGGGHGLAASLRALRRVSTELTAVVGVGDDGGSSGRIREQFGVLPPGDMRMALAALCGDDAWGRNWSRVVQHRFGGAGDLSGHSLGNLLITALWEETGDVITGLDWLAALLDAHGRVLPAASVPVGVIADVRGDPSDPERVTEVRGQASVASTQGTVVGIRIEPAEPPIPAEVAEALAEAEVITAGPGSWYTSVLANFLIPDLRAAFEASAAKKILVLNLTPQPGETSSFRPETHLEVIAEHFGNLRFDHVLADEAAVRDVPALEAASGAIGARLTLADLAHEKDASRHDADLLAAAFGRLIGRGKMAPWQ